MFSNFQGPAADPTGTFIIIPDEGNNNVRIVVIATANVTTLAGCMGNGTASGCPSATLDGTGTAASFASPDFAAIHPTNGNAFILCNIGNNVRQVTPAGVVTTVAGSYTGASGYLDGVGTSTLFNAPRGIAADPTGTFLVVADGGNCRLRKIILATSVVSTFFGTGACVDQDGIGTSASLNNPRGVAFDSMGFLYTADYSSFRVRKITPLGQIATIAGAGSAVTLNGTWRHRCCCPVPLFPVLMVPLVPDLVSLTSLPIAQASARTRPSWRPWS